MVYRQHILVPVDYLYQSRYINTYEYNRYYLRPWICLIVLSCAAFEVHNHGSIFQFYELLIITVTKVQSALEVFLSTLKPISVQFRWYVLCRPI